MNRRAFLAAGTTAALAGVAGCSTAVGTVAPPEVPDDLLAENGWERVDAFQETVFQREILGRSIEAKSRTLVFADTALRERLAEETLGNVDSDVAIVSASHVDISGDIDDLPGLQGQVLARTEAAAREGFRDRMTDQGLENVERTGTGSLPIDTGETASLTRYRAEFPVESFAVSLGDGESLTVEGGALGVEGLLAVWQHGDYLLVAGGAYPAENFTRDVTRELSDAISVEVHVDLGLTPGRYRSEVRDIVTAVE